MWTHQIVFTVNADGTRGLPAAMLLFPIASLVSGGAFSPPSPPPLMTATPEAEVEALVATIVDDADDEKQQQQQQQQQRLHVCPVARCGRAFRHHDSLERHLRSKKHAAPDDALESYTCPVTGCPRSFGRRGNLRRHVLKKHAEHVDKDMSNFLALLEYGDARAL